MNVKTHPPAGGEETSPETLTNQPNPSKLATNGGLGDVPCSGPVERSPDRTGFDRPLNSVKYEPSSFDKKYRKMFAAHKVECCREDLIEAKNKYGENSWEYKKKLNQISEMLKSSLIPLLNLVVVGDPKDHRVS